MKTKTKLKNLKPFGLRFKRRKHRVGLIALGVAAAVLIGFNFWFINHAEAVIEEIVSVRSKGKMKLKVEKFKFNWLSSKIELRDAVFYIADSTAPTVTHFSTDRMAVKARGFLQFLFKKQILIDSIYIHEPKVLITKINHAIGKQSQVNDTLNVNEDDGFSVARELGKVSNSINQVIEDLQINSFIIDNGVFSLINKTAKNDKPFVVDRININLNNLRVDQKTKEKSRDRIAFTDDFAIQTTNQNIVFPAGRHFLSFKNFRMALSDKRVEFDSCTIRGVKGDSSKSSFGIFFDKLALTNINFDTLYTTEVFRADSVFCTNPDIFFDIDGDVKTSVSNKRIQNIDELVQQLLGDVMLNHVVVANAEININTINKGRTNTFSSANNNFELQGLVVRKNLEKPVQVKRLLMTLHNYETELQDGRYSLAFDSVKFEDDAFTLNDFSFKEFGKGRLVNSLTMPRFEVRGLSWESLLYDNTFSARSAQFYSPNIIVAAVRNKAAQQKGIFETLADIGNILNLTNLGIQNGDIHLNLGKGATLDLNNTDLSLYADELTASKEIKNIQHSVNYLNVKNGVFRKGSINAAFNNVSLIENNNGISASSLLISDAGISAKANAIRLNSIILDSLDQTISIHGLTWNNGSIVLDNTTQRGKKANGEGWANNIVLNTISGGPTSFSMKSDDRTISAFLTDISISQILKSEGSTPQINDLRATGRDVLMVDPNQRLSIASLAVSDNDNSLLRNIEYTKVDQLDSILIKIPQLTIIPNITQIAAGNVYFKNLILTDPVIEARLGKKKSATLAQKKPAPQISIGAAVLQRPEVKLTLINKAVQPTRITWHGVKENSIIKLTEFSSNDKNPVQAKQVDIFLTNFKYINEKGKEINTNDNKLNLRLDDLLLQRGDSDKIDWKTRASILSLDKLYFDSLGKNNAVLQLDKGDIQNISLSSKSVGSLMEILKNSETLSLSGTSGSLTSTLNNLNWFNLSFDNGYFNADSFNIAPLQSIEGYKIKKAFNQDYLAISGGKVTGGPFNPVRYGRDTILSVRGLQFNDAKLLTFKDKRQTDTAQQEKPLFTTLIRHIPQKLDIDSLALKNMYVEYWEINPKTDTLGIVPVSELNVLMTNIRNHNLKDEDSLYILASASVLNQLFTKLEVQESYKDSLGGFLMKLQTGPMNLKQFNEILIPLEAIKVLRGNLSRLSLEAVANNNYSTGKMHMYYKGLVLRLMNKNDFERQNFGNRLLSWLANSLVVRKNNNGKEATVFFERIKNKSAINFLIKTTLNGMISSVGLPGAKTKQKKYLRQLNSKISK